MLTDDELAAIRTLDITTYGRRSGQPRRIEIWWFRIDGRFIITGTPGPRDWFANLVADPRIIIHAGGVDHPGTAVPVTDEAFRRAVFTDEQTGWYNDQSELDTLVDTAPMVEITLDRS
ncbi:MAG: nitroreductase family deazaflavin-dependent oxidoreductase [Actinomycetota bacterium]